MSVHPRKTSRGTRYEVRLRTPDGRQYKKRFRTRKEADAFEARELADQSRGVWLDPQGGHRPFRDVADEWFGSNPGKRSSTALGTSPSFVCICCLHSVTSRLPRSVRDVQSLVNTWNEKSKPRTSAVSTTCCEPSSRTPSIRSTSRGRRAGT